MRIAEERSQSSGMNKRTNDNEVNNKKTTIGGSPSSWPLPPCSSARAWRA